MTSLQQQAESKPRRRAVRSDRDYKQQQPLVTGGPLPVVNVGAIVSGRTPQPTKWIQPAYIPPRAQEWTPWIEYWDESAQARYWYNTESGEASWKEPPSYYPSGTAAAVYH